MPPNPPAPGAAYTVDLVYPSPFVFGQTPLQMCWAAVCAGAARGPLTGPFRYCDLGCGDGTSLSLLAACYPQAEFVGIDLNPAHIDLARSRAARAGLGNISFIHASLADVESLELSAFDYIVAVGVYSWIEPHLQRSLRHFARRHLRPAGLIGIHYSCLAGSAVSDPLFHYLRALAAAQAGSSLERFAAAVGALRKLSPVAGFFASNPGASELLASFERYPPAFVAHDALNRGLHSLDSGELLALLAAEGLEYLGSADVLPDYPELLLSPEGFAEFEELTGSASVPFRESVRDFMLATASRFDLFRAPGPEPVPRGKRLLALADLYLQRADPPGDSEERRRSGGAAADLASAASSAVLELAGAPAVTLGDVLSSPRLGAFAPAEVECAIERLFAIGSLNVLVERPIDTAFRSDCRYRLRSALNAERLRESLSSTGDEGLASPVLGSPLIMPAAARLRLMALLGGDVAPAWEARGGASRGTLEQFRRQVEASLPGFIAAALPRLLQLGILEADR